MKKLNKYIITFILVGIVNLSTAQVTILSTIRPAGTPRFLGWDNTGTTGNLEIRNDFTNTTTSTIDIFTNTIERMFIDAGGTGAASGYIGIGNTFTAPASRLHIRQGNNATAWFQMTGNNTGSLATDGLRIGVLNTAGSPFDVEFRQQEAAPIRFFTGSNIGGTHYERMSLNSGTFNDPFISVINNGVARVFLWPGIAI